MQPVMASAALETAAPVNDFALTDMDLYLFNEGSHFLLYQKFGAHPATRAGVAGTYFAVWAPNARFVSVIGDFNDWDKGRHPLASRGDSGVWDGFVPGAAAGQAYKYHIASQHNGYAVDKADPFGNYCETPPRTGSRIWDLGYTWNDREWMTARGRRQAHDAPISIYELHVGSWKRVAEDGNRSLTYRELAEPLAAHVKTMGFTHVEFLPITEHPFYGSWGYQCSGYFAPTARFGTPQDLMYLIDYLHQQGIGVILDWVPSHFPVDEHGLAYFDGTHLYEHANPRQGFHPDWGSYIFNYDRHEIRSFLISSGLFWLDKYHVDGLRVDAVASMLYLDYSRKGGEWIPNQYGGRENLGALTFLRRFNAEVYQRHPDVQTYAEESTAWPMVSRPTYVGGLGFGYKWDMGWMHDTLKYMRLDPVHRKHHHNQLTFRMLYAFTENYVLALSHDEVVHGKGSLLDKMSGDYWQKFANLRLMLAYQYGQAGKKLLFMGAELGTWSEWNHEHQLDWHLLNFPQHDGLRRWLADLNAFYRDEPAMHSQDCEPAGFEWVDTQDWAQSCVSFLRWGKGGEVVLAAFNFTPVPRHGYRLGVPHGGLWEERLNSDAATYGGSDVGNLGGVTAVPFATHNRKFAVELTLPPLAAVFLRWTGKEATPTPSPNGQGK
jgi:1,4-alpha-glucan branching enzyme